MSAPGWVAANVIYGLQGIVAELDAIANSAALDPAKAAAFSLAVALSPAISASSPAVTSLISGLSAAASALYNALPFLVSDQTGIDPSAPQGILALARGIRAAMDSGLAAAAFGSAADATLDVAPPTVATPNRALDAANAEIVARLARMVYLAAYVEALTGATFVTRADAITARADCATRFERELNLCGDYADLDVTRALIAMRDAAVAWLTQAVINAAPVLSVTTVAPLPALFFAWRLYGDPNRASDLIARNVVAAAEFMPTIFEAAAP